MGRAIAVARAAAGGTRWRLLDDPFDRAVHLCSNDSPNGSKPKSRPKGSRFGLICRAHGVTQGHRMRSAWEVGALPLPFFRCEVQLTFRDRKPLCCDRLPQLRRRPDRRDSLAFGVITSGSQRSSISAGVQLLRTNSTSDETICRSSLGRTRRVQRNANTKSSTDKSAARSRLRSVPFASSL